MHGVRNVGRYLIHDCAWRSAWGGNREPGQGCETGYLPGDWQSGREGLEWIGVRHRDRRQLAALDQRETLAIAGFALDGNDWDGVA